MAKVALVTGGGRGIGRAIALALAENAYAVAVTARSADQLVETADLVRRRGAEALPVVGDVTDPVDVRRVYRTVNQELGAIDVLVNNAGMSGPMLPFADIDPDDWWRVVTTNVRGPALFTQAVLPDMMKAGRGHIVNLNSFQGSNGQGSPLAYGVSKAALMRFTDSIARYVDGTGVVILDLNPGLVRTAMTSGRPDLDALPPETWVSAEAAAEKVIALVSGTYDGLHGRFVSVNDDLDELLADCTADPELRVLRLRH